MSYKRDKQGFLCFTNKDGEITNRVPEPKEEANKYMLSVDTEADDEWENKNGVNSPWTE